MKINKKCLGDVGIRLKPDEPNILENYTKFIKRTTNKKKKKKKKNKKKKTKSIEIHKKRDPLLEISEQVNNKGKEPDKEPDKEDKKPDKKPEIKKVKVEKKPQDLSETDPNVKKLVITAPTDLDPKKKGSQIKLE
jgi:hypothetical protein